MNSRRLTDLEATFIMNSSKHPCGVSFECPKCERTHRIEARWSDKTYTREPMYQKSGTTLEGITLSPAIDTKEHHGCGLRVWIMDGEVIWP